MRDLHLALAERVAKLEGKGSPAHRRALEAAHNAMRGPEFPQELETLYRWSLELFGRSGIGPTGVAPLMYGTIRDWARLTRRSPSARDVEALMRLDTAMLTKISPVGSSE